MDQDKSRRPIGGDVAFRSVWALAMGWALAEGLVAVVQGFENIYIYRDVLVSPGKEAEFLERYTRGQGISLIEENEGEQEDEEIDKLIAARTRNELEAIFGMPTVVRSLTSTLITI